MGSCFPSPWNRLIAPTIDNVYHHTWSLVPQQPVCNSVLTKPLPSPYPTRHNVIAAVRWTCIPSEQLYLGTARTVALSCPRVQSGKLCDTKLPCYSQHTGVYRLSCRSDLASCRLHLVHTIWYNPSQLHRVSQLGKPVSLNVPRVLDTREPLCDKMPRGVAQPRFDRCIQSRGACLADLALSTT